MSEEINNYHKVLANYFATKPLYLDEHNKEKLNIRKIDEQPWQQIKCRKFKELEKTLVNAEIFLALSKRDRFDIWRYWQSIPSEKVNFVTKYLKAIKLWRKELGKTKKYELVLNELSHLFYVSEKKDESLKLFEEVYKLAKSLYKNGDIRLAIRQNNLGACYAYKQNWEKAFELFENARPVFMEEYGIKHPDTWTLLEGIAVCKFHTNRVNEGIIELKKCLKFNRKQFGKICYSVANCIHNLAIAYTYEDELSKSIPLLKKELEINVKILGEKHPTTIKNKELLRDWIYLSELKLISLQLEYNQKFSESLKTYMLLEDLCTEMQSKTMMASCLYGKARMLRLLGNKDEAISEAKMALEFASDSYIKLIEPLNKFINSKLNEYIFVSYGKFNVLNKILRKIYLNVDSEEFGEVLYYGEFLRNIAARRFETGDFQITEHLLNHLLNIEFDLSSTYIHLARLFLITDRLLNCNEFISKGWDMKSKAKSYVLARLLWFKITLALIENKTIENYLSQLNALLLKDEVFKEWTMLPVLDHIKPKLTEHQYALLTALVDAMSDKQNLAKLNDFEVWRNAKEIEI
jgi:tetratricopeptide (TPR) repeat protein